MPMPSAKRRRWPVLALAEWDKPVSYEEAQAWLATRRGRPLKASKPRVRLATAREELEHDQGQWMSGRSSKT